MRSLRTPLTVAAAVAFLAGRAQADDPPKFVYGTHEGEVKLVVWKASASLGLLLTTGNANTFTLSGGATGSRYDGKNKVQLDVAGALARSTIIIVNDANGDKLIQPGELQNTTKTTAQSWLVKARYDRFFTPNNSLYVTGFASGDPPSGKDLVAGGQTGYARQVYKSAMHLLSLELGIDYSYVHYDESTMPKVPQIQMASLRAFLGYTLTLSTDTAVGIQVEVLDNLNPLDRINPTDNNPDGTASAFEDVRVLAKASLTTKLWRGLSFRFSFAAKYDNVPAPQPAGGFAFDPKFYPVPPAAQKLDTITEAALVVTFL
jgi:hypothetical protein